MTKTDKSEQVKTNSDMVPEEQQMYLQNETKTKVSNIIRLLSILTSLWPDLVSVLLNHQLYPYPYIFISIVYFEKRLYKRNAILYKRRSIFDPDFHLLFLNDIEILSLKMVINSIPFICTIVVPKIWISKLRNAMKLYLYIYPLIIRIRMYG